jgi:hypothetical protein
MRAVYTFSCLAALFLGTPVFAEPLSFSVEQVFVNSVEQVFVNSVEQVFVNEDNHDLTRVGELEFISGISVSSEDDRFGGLSDLSVSAEGRLIAISDKGDRVIARLRHDKTGALIGLAEGDITRLRTPKGKPLKGKKKSDAEGLARTANGYFVSFEHKHRIRFYPGQDPATHPAEKITPPKGLKKMPNNGGLESLVETGDGKLLTFSEDMVAGNGHTQGWLRSNNVWESIYLNRTEDFAPTGMTRLASGEILVLERSYSLLKGPAARIRLIEQKKIVAGAVLVGREIARLSGSQTVDNMEGISAVMTPDGERIYLLSDDNFNPLQRNLIFMFRFAN